MGDRVRLINKIGAGETALKSTGCSFRGPTFNSKHPCAGSQSPINPVPEDDPLFCRQQVHMQAKYSHT